MWIVDTIACLQLINPFSSHCNGEKIWCTNKWNKKLLTKGKKHQKKTYIYIYTYIVYIYTYIVYIYIYSFCRGSKRFPHETEKDGVFPTVALFKNFQFSQRIRHRKRRSSVTGDSSARALHFAFMQGTAGGGGILGFSHWWGVLKAINWGYQKTSGILVVFFQKIPISWRKYPGLGVPKMGIPPVLIHLMFGSSVINNPETGVPSFFGTPPIRENFWGDGDISGMGLTNRNIRRLGMEDEATKWSLKHVCCGNPNCY